MGLTPGTRLGPYEIEALVGAGGMGEVYKARDTRLDRNVAIKILAPEIASDPSFKARFEREARSISALRHPHICVLHNIGARSGVEYLVLEHLDGETLAARLQREPRGLKRSDVLRIAIAIAEKRPISNDGGVQPLCRTDGRELFYLSPRGQLMAVAITMDPATEFGVPRELFDTVLNPSSGVGEYGATPNGERFLMLEPVGTPVAALTLVLNWRLAPEVK